MVTEYSYYGANRREAYATDGATDRLQSTFKLLDGNRIEYAEYRDGQTFTATIVDGPLYERLNNMVQTPDGQQGATQDQWAAAFADVRVQALAAQYRQLTADRDAGSTNIQITPAGMIVTVSEGMNATIIRSNAQGAATVETMTAGREEPSEARPITDPRVLAEIAAIGGVVQDAWQSPAEERSVSQTANAAARSR